jgi:hypothetical protein
MAFFERWFGFSPDGGDGSLEAAFLVTLGGAILLAGFACRLIIRRVRVYLRPR